MAVRRKLPSWESFILELQRAIEQKDYNSLQSLMADPFMAAPYGSSYAEFTRDEALEFLKSEMRDLSIIVDISNEGRRVAQEEFVTVGNAPYVFLSYGWSNSTTSVLGIRKVGDRFVWSNLVLYVSMESE